MGIYARTMVINSTNKRTLETTQTIVDVFSHAEEVTTALYYYTTAQQCTTSYVDVTVIRKSINPYTGNDMHMARRYDETELHDLLNHCAWYVYDGELMNYDEIAALFAGLGCYLARFEFDELVSSLDELVLARVMDN